MHTFQQNPLSKSTFKAFVVVLTFLGSVTLTEAGSLRSRRTDGIIKAIDLEAHTLAIEPSASRKSAVFAWSKQTCFLRDLKRVPSTELYEGAQATIYYRSPFFGRPRLTRIIWKQAGL